MITPESQLTITGAPELGWSGWLEQNSHNATFNGVYRDGSLDRLAFYSVQDASHVISAWLDEYNIERPVEHLVDYHPRGF